MVSGKCRCSALDKTLGNFGLVNQARFEGCYGSLATLSRHDGFTDGMPS